MIKNLSVWKKAWALLDKRERRNAKLVLLVVLLAALSSAAMIGSVMPFLSILADPTRIHEVRSFAWAYRAGNFTSDYSFLVVVGFATLLTILAANVVQVVRVWIVARYTINRMHTISHRLLSSYLRQSYDFFLNRNSSAMSTQILSEAQQLVVQFYSPAANIITSSLTVIIITMLLIWVNATVSLVAFTLLGGIYGATFLLSRRAISRGGELRAEMNKERYRIANEAFGGVKEIKLLGREVSYVAAFKNPSQRMAQAEIAVRIAGEAPQYVLQAVGFGGMIVLCLLLIDAEKLGTNEVLGGLLPIVGVFAFAGQRILPELSKLYQGLIQLQYGRAALNSIYYDLVQSAPDGELPSTPPKALGLKSNLSLKGVSYRYPGSQKVGLNNMQMRIRAGERIGVVGSTGAGKTTFADLVLGLLSPTAGLLLVDGVSVNGTNIRAWQQSVGYVPQDIFLTDGSVAENIALGVAPSEIDLARIVRVAKIAQLDEFIRRELSEAYDTLVGERGIRMSGGQRQRIGIARALYHDADLIVFDEATSALDNITEREVMSAIDNLPGEKTVIIIAHRLSTVQRCDRILVLENGSIAGLDSWDSLMATNGRFRKLVENGAEMSDQIGY